MVAEPMMESSPRDLTVLPDHHTDFVFTVSGSGLVALLALVLVAALSAALLAARYRAFLIALGLGALALALGGIGVLLFGQREALLVRDVPPASIVPWNGITVAFGTVVLVIFGTAVLLGVLARMVWRRFAGKDGDLSAGGYG